MFSAKTKKKVTLFLGGMLVIHVLMWVRVGHAIRAGYPDFTSFYAAGKIVARGLGRRLYDEPLEWQVQQEFASGVTTRKASLPYVHAPFEAWLFVPLSRAGYVTAYLLWNLVNLAILMSLPWLLKPQLAHLQRVTLAEWLFCAFAFLPIVFSMIQGQDALVLLLCYCLAYLCLKRDRQFAAGFWLGLGLFRFHLVIPFIAIMCLARKWKVVGGFCCGTVPVALLSAAVVGWRGVLRYPEYIWFLEQHTGRGILLPRDTPTFRGMLEDLLSHWFGGREILIVVVCVSALLIYFAAKAWPTQAGRSEKVDLAFCLSLVVTELVSYHSFIYDFSVLFLPVLIVFNYIRAHPISGKWAHIELVLPMFALFFTPLYLFVWLDWRRSDLMGLVLLAFCWAIAREISRVSKPASSTAHLAEGPLAPGAAAS